MVWRFLCEYLAFSLCSLVTRQSLQILQLGKHVSNQISSLYARIVSAVRIYLISTS